MYQLLRRAGIVVLAVGCALTLSFTVLQISTQAHNLATAATSVSAAPGYKISVFAKGTSSYSHPDSVDVAGGSIYIGYQNITAKDGTDNKTSTIVQYSSDGKVENTFSIPGHCDGLRFNSESGLLWATSNEDGNPRIVTIDPSSGKITSYKFPATPHGGGYDDVIFLNNMAFIAASNPTLNSAGVNVFPAVDKITLKNGKAILKPILMGNASAVDENSSKKVKLNLTDPDSLSIDIKGNLVLDDQGDSQLITAHDAGTDAQKVTRVSVKTQVDDSSWITSSEGALLIVDGAKNTTYILTHKHGFKKGTIYTESPSDSSIPALLGTLNPTTGVITSVVTGLSSPTGLVFWS